MSQFGVMPVPDQSSAPREMVRVTKPGGWVLLIAYGPPAELEFLRFFMGFLRAVVPYFPDQPIRSKMSSAFSGSGRSWNAFFTVWVPRSDPKQLKTTTPHQGSANQPAASSQQC
jgi:hypothetical protein